ncbi:hypothetical protein DU46_14020 [Methanosarcina mazei]|uniref:Uncharacterized protein n=1 Tax=Methanosarcina mazei TaxID=2209 RepID=A0A0F8I7P6_METMZ|nr:hypothetical protein DU46_14020 [Methanosarcina mazei]
MKLYKLIPKIKVISLSFKSQEDKRSKKNISEILVNVEYKICFGTSFTIIEAANIVKKRWNGILNCFESKITNGIW